MNRFPLVLWSLAFAAVLTFLYWVIWVAPEQLASPSPTRADLNALEGKERADAQLAYANAKNAVRTTLIQALAGAAFLTTAFFAWRQVTTSRLGQLTDRFARSIDHIGSDSATVRIGAIYTLEQLSDDERFATPVAQVLVAFLRRPTTHGADRPTVAHPPRLLSVMRRRGAQRDERQLAEVDVQQAANIAIRKGLWKRVVGTPLNLQSADLNGIGLPKAELAEANFRGAKLRNCNLQEAFLQEADLREADLSSARLEKSNLSRAWLNRAMAAESNLSEATSSDGMTCRGANFEGAILERVKFSGTDFSGARMKGVRAAGAQLRLAEFVGADLRNADFTGADLTGANFSGAELTDAIWEGAVLTSVENGPTDRRAGGQSPE